jgi:hypothetical protein
MRNNLLGYTVPTCCCGRSHDDARASIVLQPYMIKRFPQPLQDSLCACRQSCARALRRQLPEPPAPVAAGLARRALQRACSGAACQFWRPLALTILRLQLAALQEGAIMLLYGPLKPDHQRQPAAANRPCSAMVSAPSGVS